MTDLVYRQASSEYADQMVDLELRCFPTIERDELLTVEGIELQERLFPEGAFMVLDGKRIVGMASGIFVNYDISKPQHDMHAVTGHEGVANHDPDGDWYYGTDIAVHAEYRRRGIGRMLYDLRKDLVRRLDKRGIVAGGHLHGFAEYKGEMSAVDYMEAVRDSELYDPTLSFQLNQGFELVGALENYLADEATDGWSALIVWRNPDVQGGGAMQ